MKRFFAKIGRFFWSRGFLKFVLWSITLIVFLYIEEDWRGARAWAVTKAKWEAQGENFDPNFYFPKPVPKEENLAALPIFQKEPDPDNASILSPLKLKESLTDERHGGELPSYSKPDEFRAKLAAAYANVFPQTPPPSSPLAQFDALYPILAQLREASSSHPYCRFDEDYAKQPPQYRDFGLLAAQIQLSKKLSLHAHLALDTNQPQVALDDIKLNLKIAAAVGRDPTLVGSLIAIAMTAITRDALIDGLNRHVWNDAQLADLQSELARMDFLAQYQFSFRGEILTIAIPAFDSYQAEKFPKEAASNVFAYLPSGWLKLNKVRIVDFLFRELKCTDPKSHRVFPDVSQEMERKADEENALPGRLAPWNIFSSIAAGPFSSACLQFARCQSRLDEDQIACGLERYRLVHGTYPDLLDALVPSYIPVLPHDIMNGEACHYRLRPDGTFLLYSVGWNQIDEGGKPVKSPRSSDYKQGDWIWPAR